MKYQTAVEQFWLSDWQTDAISDCPTVDHARHFAAASFSSSQQLCTVCSGICNTVFTLYSCITGCTTGLYNRLHDTTSFTTGCMKTAGCTTGRVNYANEPSQAALERSSQDAYDVIRLTRSKAAMWTVNRWRTVVSGTTTRGWNVSWGRSPSVTFSTEGRHNFHVPRTTVCHTFCRMANYKNLEL